MKLYSAPSVNPRRVRIFLAEKGSEIPRVDLNILKGESRTPEILRLNSLGQVPVLEFDDGRVLTESVAICRFLESEFPDPPLMGVGAFDQAHIEMWNRRVEFQILATLSNIIEHKLPIFAEKIEQVSEFAATQRRAAPKKWEWLNNEMADGRPFIAGERFSIADITGMVALAVSDYLEITIPEDLEQVHRWAEVVKARPSWSV